uniref:ARAD1C19536p n=1 Tax=Blastobotrys adeninivorans TaxID=409370 RepID=A0A060T0Y7_BLAAD
MGANQSVPTGPKESLYEILGVEKTATEIELKKAYKKKALLLHPDRNFNNEEEATREFTRVQAAYDVLSDPQERAWYDSHGTTGGPAGGEPQYGGTVTTTEDLKQYFEPSWYHRVEKNDEFYELIGQLIDQLIQEENEAALDEGLDGTLLPKFGDERTPWNQVRAFYDNWSSFASMKSFAWEDVYRAFDTDRRTRRAAEARNKKIREAAKREFNSTVRKLVTVIKQKDPRVRQYNKQRKQAPGNAAAKEQAKRDRQAQAANRKAYQEQDWAKVDEGDVNFASDSDDDKVVDLFECVVCDKVFKTKKMLNAHESSKKHKKQLAQLKRQMRKEGVELGFDDFSNSDDSDDDSDDEKYESKTANGTQVGNGANNDDETAETQEPKVAEPVEAEAEPEPEAKSTAAENENSDEESDEEEAKKAEPTLEDLLAELEGTRISNKNSPEPEVRVKGKAKKKRQKREKSQNEFALTCTVCQTEFPSRNKLFQHVKASGHAAPVRRK